VNREKTSFRPDLVPPSPNDAARIRLSNEADLKAKALHQQRILEVSLILLAIGITALLFRMQGFKIVILNLYFLPVVISGFFLGRYRAGVLAVLCVLGASIVTAMGLFDVIGANSPLVTALSVAVWAAVLGLTAILIGTLSDDRASKLEELHDAYVGVVEVLAQYLQGAHPRMKARSIRVAELSHNVATRLRLSPREIDDIRVGALLYDVGNIEITTRVIRRAMDSLDTDSSKAETQTIQGTDLMVSLASVLSGAVPLLITQQENRSPAEIGAMGNIPLGAQVIASVRAYDALTEGAAGDHRLTPSAAIHELRAGKPSPYDPAVLAALERVVLQNDRSSPLSSGEQRNSHAPVESLAP
jgi:HD-GYP domain-containing protein (c-di-GMP phosphodiesterase class II)